MKEKLDLFNKLIITVILSFGISGCGLQTFIPPKENPVISDNINRSLIGHRIFKVVSNTPERRVIVFNLDKDDKQRYGKFCSEAPADAAESLSSTFQVALQATLEKQGGSAEAAKSLATAIQSLAPRSQGIMLYRDATYRYCEAYLNGLISDLQYAEKLDTLVDKSIELIAEELAKNNGKIGFGPPVSENAPD